MPWVIDALHTCKHTIWLNFLEVPPLDDHPAQEHLRTDHLHSHRVGGGTLLGLHSGRSWGHRDRHERREAKLGDSGT